MPVTKVERVVRDPDGRKLPLLDERGEPVLVTRGRHKGTPRYRTAVWLDARGRPRWQATPRRRSAIRILIEQTASSK